MNDSSKSGEIAFVCRGDSRIIYRSILLQELDEAGKPVIRADPANAVPEDRNTATAKKSRAADLEIRRGTRWTGMKVWNLDGATLPPGTKQEITLEITEVTGAKFKGVFTWPNMETRTGPGERQHRRCLHRVDRGLR